MLEQTPIQEEPTAFSLEAAPPVKTSSPSLPGVSHLGEGRGVDPNWRAGLEARIAAHQELGLSHNEATAFALREMREAELARHGAGRTGAAPLERGLLARLRKRLRSLSFSPPLFADARAATGIALPLFALPWIDAFILGPPGYLFRLWAYFYHLNLEALDGSQPAVNACLQSYSRFELFAVPLLAGLLAGLLARKNATRGVWNALALLAIPAILCPGVIGGLTYADLLPKWAMGGQGFISHSEIAAWGVGCWALLGVGGARIGRWLREKRSARRSLLNPEVNSEASIASQANTPRTRKRLFSLSPPLFPDAVAATAVALPLFSLAWWADNSTRAFDLWQQFFQEDRWKLLSNGVLQIVRSSQDAGFYRFELFVIPTLVGLLTGLLTRRNAARGVLNALALLAIPALLLPGMAAALQMTGVIPEQTSLHWLPEIKPAVNGVAVWALFGAGSAQAAQWVKGKAGALWSRVQFRPLLRRLGEKGRGESSG